MTSNELTELYFKRDERALELTEKNYKNYCISIAMNILGNMPDAEECFNDTLSALWNSIPPANPPDIRAYMARIIRNLCIDRTKRYNAAKRINRTTPLQEIEDCFPGADVENEAIQNELRAALNRFLDSCGVKERAIFVRRYYYMDQVSDIAMRYGMRPNAVTKQLARTRDKLRRFLVKEGYEV